MEWEYSLWRWNGKLRYNLKRTIRWSFSPFSDQRLSIDDCCVVMVGDCAVRVRSGCSRCCSISFQDLILAQFQAVSLWAKTDTVATSYALRVVLYRTVLRRRTTYAHDITVNSVSLLHMLARAACHLPSAIGKNGRLLLVHGEYSQSIERR